MISPRPSSAAKAVFKTAGWMWMPSQITSAKQLPGGDQLQRSRQTGVDGRDADASAGGGVQGVQKRRTDGLKAVLPVGALFLRTKKRPFQIKPRKNLSAGRAAPGGGRQHLRRRAGHQRGQDGGDAVGKIGLRHVPQLRTRCAVKVKAAAAVGVQIHQPGQKQQPRAVSLHGQICGKRRHAALPHLNIQLLKASTGKDGGMIQDHKTLPPKTE